MVSSSRGFVEGGLVVGLVAMGLRGARDPVHFESLSQGALMTVDFEPSEDLYPFASKWFESSVGLVHYIDEGEGRPIVFFHGEPMWSFLYRRIVVGLRDRFRCVAVDYPGFGLSVRPDDYGYTPKEHAHVVGELVDHLDLADMIVMGQDWGGPISLSVASARADRVSGIVLGNTWFWRDAGARFRLLSRLMSTGFMQRQIVEKNFFIERLVPTGVATKLADEVMEHYRAVQPTPEMRAGMAQFPIEILASGEWLDELDGQVKTNLVSKQVLLVWGMKDLSFRPKFLTRLKEEFPDQVVVELPEAKHFIQEDAPDEIIAAITDRFG